LGIAIIYDGGKLADLNPETTETKLEDIQSYNEYEIGGTFLGIMGIKDPIRPEAVSAIEDCKTAGINVMMITGDSKETAVAIAKELNIIEENEDLSKCSFTGMEFEKLETEEAKMKALSG